MTNKSALRGYAEMVDALLARWQPGTELHVTGGGAHNLHEVLGTYRPMVEEIERLTRDMAALQSQWDDMQQGFVEVFGEPVRDAIELLGTVERIRSGNEPGVGVLPGQVIAYQNGKIEGLQAKLAEIHKWADAWSKPPHSDASESDKGWYWAAQEVQNLLDPNPQGASRDASLPLTEKCPQCGLQMFNWPGQMTKCSKCLHEWHMNTLRTGEQ